MRIRLKWKSYYTKHSRVIILLKSRFIKAVQRIVLYSNLNELPILVYMEIKEKENLKLLKKRLRWIPVNPLNQWNKLDDDFNLLSGGEHYLSMLREMKELLIRMNDLNILVGAFNLYQLGDNEGYKVLKAFGYDPLTAHKMILRESTDIQLSRAEFESRASGTEKERDFYDKVAKVENILKRNLDLNGMSCKRWIYILKNLKHGSNKKE